MKRDEVEPAYVYPLPLGAAIVMLVVMTSDLAALQICSADLDFSATKAGKKRARAMNNGRADALRAASNGRTKAPPIITQVSGAGSIPVATCYTTWVVRLPITLYYSLVLSITLYYSLVLSITRTVSCSCVHALNTRSSKLPVSPAASRSIIRYTTRLNLLSNHYLYPQLLPADIAKAGAALVSLAVSAALLFQAFVLPSFATVVPLVNKALPALMQIEVTF